MDRRAPYAQIVPIRDSTLMSVNGDLYRRWIAEAWNNGDVDVLDELHTPDFVNRSGLSGVTPDTAGMKRFILRLRAAFPDAVLTIEDIVVEGDRVAGRWTMTGTHAGESYGRQATGKQVILTGFDLLRVAGARFAEIWYVEDRMGLLQQLGGMPARPPS